MYEGKLDELTQLEAAATPAPWHHALIDDPLCMSMVVITTDPEIDAFNDIGDGKTIIAATLLQAPRCIDHADKKWDENAALIAAIRNELPELIRLARIGLKAQG